jgi:hypothetical protein
MKSVKQILVGAIAAMALSTSAFGAAMNLTGTVAASYTTAGVLVANNPDVSSNPGVDRIYRIDLFYTFQSAIVGQDGFGNLSMNVGPLSGVTRVPANVGQAKANYTANNPLWTETDGSTSHQTYSDNSDLGNTTDLTNIVVGIDPNNPQVFSSFGGDPNDPRPSNGKSGPVKFGSVFVDWSGNAPASVGLTLNQHSFYTANATGGVLVLDSAGTNSGGTVLLGAVPEPGSLSLLAIGGLVAVRRRRA